MCVSVCAAAGPAVESWVAHVCRLPDAEACSVLGLSLCGSLSLHTHTLTHIDQWFLLTLHTCSVCRMYHLPERNKREGEVRKEGDRREWAIRMGITKGNGEKESKNTKRNIRGTLD